MFQVVLIPIQLLDFTRIDWSSNSLIFRYNFSLISGSWCYWFSPPGDHKIWTDAHKTCQQLYSHPTDLSKSSNLVSIHSQVEQDFLVAHVWADRAYPYRWTGLHEESDGGRTLYWTDQTAVDYSNWNYREPMLTLTVRIRHSLGVAYTALCRCF